MRDLKLRLILALLLSLPLLASVPQRISSVAPPETGQDGSGLFFVENIGQFHPQARFQARSAGATLWLAEDSLWLTLVAPTSADRVRPTRGLHLRLAFPGANPHPRLEPFARQQTVVNYYRGNEPAQWHTGVPVWGGVRYVDLYPGVDLVVGTDVASAAGRSQGALSWRLEADGGADLSLVRLRIEGADEVSVEDRYLRLSTALGDTILPLPTFAGAVPAAVPSGQRLSEAVFEIASPYAPARPAAIASAQANDGALLLATYLGGSDYDRIDGVAADGSGAVYVTGATFSTDFPTEGPGETSSLHGNCDLFVTKLGRPAALFRPVYSTYLGGSYDDPSDAYDIFFTDAGLDIAVEDGAAYVVGYTWSDDFPTTSGAYDTTFNGPAVSPDASPDRPGFDGFVVKLDAAGSLAYGTYLGGSGYTIPGGGRGGGDDEARGIAVRDGVAYVTGYTKSADFPTTPGAYKRTYAEVNIGLNDDVFVVKLNPAGQGSADLLYSTFVGGGLIEKGNDIAVDGAGVAYVTGYAHGHPYEETNSDFPITPGAFDTELKGDDWDAFFFKLNPAGQGGADLLYSTFLGTGSGWDYGHAIAVDGGGRAYLVGNTTSADFPTTSGAIDTTCGTDGQCNYIPGLGAKDDVFVAQLNPAGQGQADLLYSTFLGGGGIDGGIVDWADIGLDGEGDVYVTGVTYSSDFPVTPDAYDGALAYGADAFIARLHLGGQGIDDLVYSTFLGGHDGDYGLGIALEASGVVWVGGYTESSDFPTTDGVSGRAYRGGGDGFVVKMMAPPPTPKPDLSPSTKTVSPQTVTVGEEVTFTVHLVNQGDLAATASFTDTLPEALLLHGTPTASRGTPVVNGQTITWSGDLTPSGTVTITYTALLTSTTVLTPTAVNEAYVADGLGNIYLRRAFVNGHHVFLPLLVRQAGQ